MSDGLTAEQEARRRYPDGFRTYVGDWEQLRVTFVAGTEWATKGERSRAEAAEARVKYLEGLGSRAQLDMLEFERSERHRSEARVAELKAALKKWVDWYDGVQYADRDVPDMARESRILAAAPTTEAVTE